MKRLSLLLFALMVVALAACGGGQDEPAEGIEQEIPVQEETALPQEAEEDEDEADEVIPVRHRTDLAQVGDIMEFGDYSWIVLDVYGDYALLLSEHVLVMHEAFSPTNPHILAAGLLEDMNLTEGEWIIGVFHETHVPTNWERSSLRRYLNNEFLNRFDPVDRTRIRETHVAAHDNPWYLGEGLHAYFGDAGDDTVDRIFLLSVQEIVYYFGDSGQLENQPERTAGTGRIRWIYDEFNDARIGRTEDGEPMWWWTRTPGRYRRLIAGVDVLGSIYMDGIAAMNPGGGARPAMWVNLTSPWDEENFAEIREPLHLAEDTPHGDLAMQHLAFMNDNLYSRLPFSYREKETAAWIIEELLAMGHPWEHIEVREFVADNLTWWRIDNHLRIDIMDMAIRESTRLSQYIILTVPGQSEYTIVVGAHYDSWDTPGASDNGSDTSVFLNSTEASSPGAGHIT